jgi:hypothetical protein
MRARRYPWRPSERRVLASEQIAEPLPALGQDETAAPEGRKVVPEHPRLEIARRQVVTRILWLLHGAPR